MNAEWSETSPECTRRRWLIAGARGAVLSVLVGLTGYLGLKSRRLECTGRTACRKCGLLDSCGLPEAGAARREMKG